MWVCAKKYIEDSRNPQDDRRNRGWRLEGSWEWEIGVVAISWLYETVAVFLSVRRAAERSVGRRGEHGASEALFAPEIRLPLVDYNRIKIGDVGPEIYSVCLNLVSYFWRNFRLMLHDLTAFCKNKKLSHLQRCNCKKIRTSLHNKILLCNTLHVK